MRRRHSPFRGKEAEFSQWSCTPEAGLSAAPSPSHFRTRVGKNMAVRLKEQSFQPVVTHSPEAQNLTFLERRRQSPTPAGTSVHQECRRGRSVGLGHLDAPCGHRFHFHFLFFLYCIAPPPPFSWSSSLGDRGILLLSNFRCRDPIIYVFII